MFSFMRRWSAPFERREMNGSLSASTITTPLLANDEDEDDDDDDDDDDDRDCESVQPKVWTAAEADDSDDDDDDDYDEVFETGWRLELRPALHH